MLGSMSGDPCSDPNSFDPASAGGGTPDIVRSVKPPFPRDAEMVAFLFPETLQFPVFKQGGIPGPPKKYRLSEGLKTPKIAPKNYSKKGECVMPRMSKKMKHEWSMFLKPNGRRGYNSLCRRCVHPCKQSFRVMVVECPRYYSKRAVVSYDHT